MNITIFGAGYVGLVQAAVFAKVGNNVLCVDIDERKVEALSEGEVPFFEPGLNDLVSNGVRTGRLRFTSSLSKGVSNAEILFVAVGTPSNHENAADLSYVTNVVDAIGRFMESRKIVINKSTVPVGTADMVASRLHAMLAERKADISFDVVSNPEFLKEGSAVADCQSPDRIIIGSNNPSVVAILRELYAPFNRNHDKIITMGVRSAELAKYAANSMLATKISFMNEMANIAERVGADIEEVRQGIGSDPRIGFSFIYPGCGYGGACFPKDVKALIKTAADLGYSASLIQSVEDVNNSQKHRLFDYILAYFRGELSGLTVALWGLSFKPNTDDMREAPSRALIDSLLRAGATVQAFDPVAIREARVIYGERTGLEFCATKEDALVNADALVLVTEWGEFKSPDFDYIRDTLNTPVIFDGRNQYNPALVESKGISYYGIGRGRSLVRTVDKRV